MTSLLEIQSAFRQLPPDELAAFRAWYAEFDAEEWYEQIEADVAAGRLDWLVAEAREDLKQGRCTER